MREAVSSVDPSWRSMSVRMLVAFSSSGAAPVMRFAYRNDSTIRVRAYAITSGATGNDI